MSHYLISEASRLVDEESHVLRYWEEELSLKIPRNDLGHRYYTEVQLEIFRTIKELKQQGYQLKEIKQYLEEMEKTDEAHRYMDQHNANVSMCKRDGLADGAAEGMEERSTDAEPEEAENIPMILPPENHARRKEIKLSSPALASSPTSAPAEIQQQAKMREFKELMTDILAEVMTIGFDRMSDEVSERVSRQLIKEINYLDREREEKEEIRFKELDEAIRSRQRRGKYRAEAAATISHGKRKRRWEKNRFGR